MNVKEFGALCLVVASVFVLGVATGRSTAANYEDEYREELESIYMLLGGMSATQRVNMNLSQKTNHYLTHGGEGATCDDCVQHLRNFVDSMPPLPRQQQESFDMMYTSPLSKLEKMNRE